MISERATKALIFYMLGLFTISAFFIRLDNFKNSRAHSIDEAVYYRMAQQINNEGLSGYHTMPYGEELAAAERALPDYFFQPLFKHPPLFTFLSALSMKIFGDKPSSAAYVSILFGVLLIPLVYLFAKLLFDRKIALISSIFMWLDPVTIISSQKVWMDTTLSFFIVLTLYLFTLGKINQKERYYILSGLACGLAMLVKYNGILPLIGIALYALTQQPVLYKSRNFQLGMILPFVVFAPWVYWNFTVFGSDIFIKLSAFNNLHLTSARTQILLISLVILLIGIFLKLKLYSQSEVAKSDKEYGKSCFTIVRAGLIGVCSILLFISLLPSVVKSLNLNTFPTTSWTQGLFYGESPLFYFKRLTEWSLIFFVSFVAFFINIEDKNKNKLFLSISTGVMFIFLMIWGSFQSRYALICIPLLIILGVNLWVNAIEKAEHLKYGYFYKLMLSALLAYTIINTYYLNLVLSYPNDMCYF